MQLDELWLVLRISCSIPGEYVFSVPIARLFQISGDSCESFQFAGTETFACECSDVGAKEDGYVVLLC